VAGARGTTTCTPSNAACTNPYGYLNSCQWYITNSGSCSAADDDKDADGVPDSIDNCPTVSNPPVAAGSYVQADADRDGLGDACDPAPTLDDDQDGSRTTSPCSTPRSPAAPCRSRTDVRDGQLSDLDGDHDAFPTRRDRPRPDHAAQRRPSLSGVVLTLSSTDTDVACITQGTLPVASIAPAPR